MWVCRLERDMDYIDLINERQEAEEYDLGLLIQDEDGDGE